VNQTDSKRCEFPDCRIPIPESRLQTLRQAVRVIAAKVIGKAVVGPDKADLNLDVVRGRRQSRKHELDIHCLFVHIPNARFDVDSAEKPPIAENSG
jgi:hypothetical protein